MTIQELTDILRRENIKRDWLNELTPENNKLLHQKCDGTFEAVLVGKANQKCLIPDTGTLHFLYRGQNREVIPCLPTLYRGNPSEEEIFVERMRLTVFKRLLKTHPVIEHFFNKHHFFVDVEGIAQHYGLKTSVLDLTSDLDIALFFATSWYDDKDDSFHYYDDKQVHKGVLYVFDPLFDNEPCPSMHEENYLNHNIKPIGFQAFPRPGAQKAYSLRIEKDHSTKSWLYRFTYTSEDSKFYYDKYNSGNSLWIKDKLIAKVKQIINQTEFSFKVFNETYMDYNSKTYSKTKLKHKLPENIKLKTNTTETVFTAQERVEIINDWNAITGAQMASLIRRKPWFEHEGRQRIPDSNNKYKLLGVNNNNDYRTLKIISQIQLLTLVGAPDPIEGAEWCNYKNTPRPKEKSRKDDGSWEKVPATMLNYFGKPYLSKEDWFIK